MGISFSKRGLIRTVSFAAALMLVLTGLIWQNNTAAKDYQNQLESTYMRALGDLSTYLSNISTDLDKGQYIGTSGQLSLLSARIWRESGGAKSALSTLPVNDLHMEGTYKFLSQAGDYAMMLSKKVTAGGVLTPDEKQNAQALRQYAGKLRDYVDSVHQQIRDGQLEVTALRTANPEEQAAESARQTGGLSGGFEDIEQTMTGYPTLIYDGPFSDHLLTRKPRLTAGMAAITPEAALEKAARAARVNPEHLTRGDDENSNMPSYTFYGGGISVGITKAGGLVTYMINPREIGDQRLNSDAVYLRASQYLSMLGIENMRPTYYDTADGIRTINYAAMSGDVTLYTDLIKVGVALDDGGIVFYDGRGYINNHRERELPAPTLTQEQAAASVNPDLTILSSRLALIPTSGQGEVLTYEFRTKTKDKQNLLIYVNAATGAEEQILILIETPEGTLTR